MSGANRVTAAQAAKQSAAAADLFAQIHELCTVFRAESGMACRMTIDERHTRFEVSVGAAVLRNIRRVLTNVSKAHRATMVTLSSGTYADGSVFIRIADGNAMPAAQSELYQFIIIDDRLVQLGGELILGDASGSSATIVLSHGLVVEAR